jgi:phasin
LVAETDGKPVAFKKLDGDVTLLGLLALLRDGILAVNVSAEECKIAEARLACSMNTAEVAKLFEQTDEVELYLLFAQSSKCMSGGLIIRYVGNWRHGKAVGLTPSLPKVPRKKFLRDQNGHRNCTEGVASGVLNRKRPSDEHPMDRNTKTSATKSVAFREMTEKGTAQAKETYEKMSAATKEAAALIENTYTTAMKGVHDYNNKYIEFAVENTKATFDFLQKLSTVKSPSEFMELSSDHARKQREALTEQTKQLAALAQKVTLASAEPLKSSVAKTFNHLP